MEAGTESDLGYTKIRNIIPQILCYFKINCFSGDTQIIARSASYVRGWPQIEVSVCLCVLRK